MLEASRSELAALSEAVHAFAFDIVFAPLQAQIATIPEMEVCVQVCVRGISVWCWCACAAHNHTRDGVFVRVRVYFQCVCEVSVSSAVWV